MDKNKSKLTENKIMELLATQLGVEVEDINMEDSFISDLRMNPAELTDFLDRLESIGYDIADIDFREIESVGELIEILSEQQI